MRQLAESDPHTVSTMVMRVVKSPAVIRWNPGRGVLNAPADLKLSQYNMVIDYRLEGEVRKASIGGPPLAFPIRSSEREAEVAKAAAAQSK